MFAAAPLMLKSLQMIAADPGLEPDLRAIALHVIEIATTSRV
jgi:hypothetical protein